MGAIPGVEITKEPVAQGYLRGQVFNRPLPRLSGWILFRVVYNPLNMPDWVIPSTSSCPDPLIVLPSPRDCYKLSAHAVSASAYPRGRMGEPIGDEIDLDWRYSPAVDAIDYPPGSKVRTIGLNLADVSVPYLFIEFRRDYSSGEIPVSTPESELLRRTTITFSMGLGEYLDTAEPAIGGLYSPGSYYKFGWSSEGERLLNSQGNASPQRHLNQQYASIGAFIDVRNLQGSHLSPSNGEFVPFLPQLGSPTSFNQYTGSSLGSTYYTIDEGEI